MPGELVEGDRTGPFRPFVQIRLAVSTSYDLAIHTCKRAPSSPTNWTLKLRALFMVNSIFFFPLWFAWWWFLTRLTGWLIIKISLASDCWGWNLVFYCGGWPLCEYIHKKIKMKYFVWRITPPPSVPPLGDCNYTHPAGGRNVSNGSFRMKKMHFVLKKRNTDLKIFMPRK